jgi:hypothetical protein
MDGSARCGKVRLLCLAAIRKLDPRLLRLRVKEDMGFSHVAFKSVTDDLNQERGIPLCCCCH